MNKKHIFGGCLRCCYVPLPAEAHGLFLKARDKRQTLRNRGVRYTSYSFFAFIILLTAF